MEKNTHLIKEFETLDY